MRIQARNLVLFIFIIVQPFEGVLPEIVLWMCMIGVAINQYNINKEIIGGKAFSRCFLFIALFFVLFLIQTQISDDLSLVRLYGLTKCICAPALLTVSFAFAAKNGKGILYPMLASTMLNLVYTIALFTSGFDYTFCSILGSYNGCASVGVIIFPCVVSYLKYCKENDQRMIPLIRLYIISMLVLVILSDSATAQVLLVAQIIAYIVPKIKTGAFARQIFKCSVFLGVVLLLAFVWAIASGVIPTSGQELRTRAMLWTVAYRYITGQETAPLIWGTGNDYIYPTQIAEAHDVFLEILLIYGVVGCTIFVIFVLWVVIKMIKTQYAYQFYLIVSFISYLLTCMMHPFYTGMFLNQTLCILPMLFMVFFDFNRHECWERRVI